MNDANANDDDGKPPLLATTAPASGRPLHNQAATIGSRSPLRTAFIEPAPLRNERPVTTAGFRNSAGNRRAWTKKDGRPPVSNHFGPR